MKKLFTTAVCIGAISLTGTAFGAPITFTDTTLFTDTGTIAPEDLVSYGGGDVNLIGDNSSDGGIVEVDWVTWEHQFIFDPAAATILDAELSITLQDDPGIFGGDDLVLEFALGWAEDGSWDLGEVDTGIYSYNVDVAYVGDGFFEVTIANADLNYPGVFDIFGQDFYITQSDLTITYEPIPEPTTMLLFGAGIAGLAVVGRKRRK